MAGCTLQNMTLKYQYQVLLAIARHNNRDYITRNYFEHLKADHRP